MRTLKFRIWNTKNKCFYTDEHVKTNFFSFFIERMPGEPIMQYTGLLDKNGKEIYEGDIVSCEDKYGVVEYDPQQGGFIILFQPHNEKQKSECAYLASTYPSPIKEIIGNIYQNPELLK